MQFFKINLTEIIINYKNLQIFGNFKNNLLNKCKTIDKILQKQVFINNDQKYFCKNENS